MDVRMRIEQVIRQYSPAVLEARGLLLDMEKWSRERNGHRVILERHKLSRLLNNKARSVSLELLGVLCDYLIERCGVPQHVLPQALIGAKEHNVLDLIRTTNQVRFFLGMRSSDEWGRNTYVMAADAALQSKVTSLISHYVASRRGRILKGVDTTLVNAPPREVNVRTASVEWKETKESTAKHYESVLKASDVSVVLTGSTKVNGIVEQVVASAFKDTAYKAPKVSRAADRKVPVFVRYRDSDPQPSSCFGGTRMSPDQPSPEPGIYYECADRTWDCLPCDDVSHDAAVVAYTQSLERNRVFLVCSGFSWRATHLLTNTLDELIDLIWPPQIETPKLIVGMFLVQFYVKPPKDGAGPGNNADPKLERFRVVRIADEAIKRRINKDTFPGMGLS